MTTWSAAEDLRSLAGATSVGAALRRLGCCPSDHEERCQLTPTPPWRRAGAETYGLTVLIEHHDGTTSPIYAKACVAIGELHGVGSIVDEWIRRRRILTADGLATPTLYGVLNATIYEEFIPHSAWDALNQINRPDQLIRELGFAAGTLTRRGFACLDVTDWRSRGSDVVLVDFGEDLGPPGVISRDNMGLVEDIISRLELGRPKLTPSQTELFSQGLEEALRPDSQGVTWKPPS